MITNPVLKNAELQATDPQAYTNNVLQAVLSVFFLVAIVYFIWSLVMAGYHLISSVGDPKKLEVARHQITYALIGLTVIFSIFAILKFVGSILGLNDLENLTIPWPTL